MIKFRNSMRIWLLLATTVFATLSCAAEQPVVIELFTSEGCSSCPPADALLGQLGQQRTGYGVELVLLGEHVEYWNGPGWKDRFSGQTFTERQYEYARRLHLATPYTPQVVVDGRLQTTGGNGTEIKRFIAEAAQKPKPATVTLKTAGEKLQVAVSAPSDRKLQVLLAVTEDNLTTEVRGGENQGRTLKHAAVVRELRPIGKTADGRFEKTVSVPLGHDWKKQDLRAIVLIQDTNSGVIEGASSIGLSGSGEMAAIQR